MSDVYRSAASILLLRPSPQEVQREGDPYQILLLHKARKRDAWQLPQGGVEQGESIEDAALRELSEEAGISGVKLLGKSEQVYQYDFPSSYRRFRPDHVCGQRIFFIFALAPDEVEVHVDGREVDKHAWVFPQDLPLYVKRKEYLSLLSRLLEQARDLLRERS